MIAFEYLPQNTRDSGDLFYVYNTDAYLHFVAVVGSLLNLRLNSHGESGQNCNNH